MKMKTVLLGAVSLLIVGGAVAGVFVLRNQKTAAAKELAAHDSLAARAVPSAPQGASGQAMPDSATMRSLAAASAADPAAGEKVFAQCRVCHAIGPGATNKTGPGLNGVVGRPGFVTHGNTVAVINLAYGGQRELARGALQQAHAEPALQVGDTSRQP